MIQFDLPKQKSSIIKVLGVGGGGSNAVNFMFHQDIEGVDFIICNTDSKAIEQSPVPNKIQLGPHLTQGLGAGADPSVGKLATEESLEEIKRILEVNTKMAFITVGMGGGTGTGGAPIIAKICKDLGILTVGIVTTPFGFEGPRRQKQAEDGINQLKPLVDTLLVISNDKLRVQYGNLKMKEAFTKADNVLATAAKCITDVINSRGHIIVDFADVCTVMKNGGVAILGKAEVEGENRAQRAIEEALNSPLLNDNDIKGAKWILLNINSAEGDFECSMDELETISNILRERTGEHSDVIMGSGYDDTLGEKIGITLIATGFEGKDPFKKEEPKKAEAPIEEKIVMTLATEAPELIEAPEATSTTAVENSIVSESINEEPIQNSFENDNHFVLDTTSEEPIHFSFAVRADEVEVEAPIVEEVVMEAAIVADLNEAAEYASLTIEAADTMEALNLTPTLVVEENAIAFDAGVNVNAFDAGVNVNAFDAGVNVNAFDAGVNVFVATPEVEENEEIFELNMDAVEQDAHVFNFSEATAEFVLSKPSNIYAEEQVEEEAVLDTEPVVETMVAEAPMETVAEIATEIASSVVAEVEAPAEVFQTSFRVAIEEEPAMQLVMREEENAIAYDAGVSVNAFDDGRKATQNFDMPIDDSEEQRRKVRERIQKLRNLSFNIGNGNDPSAEFDEVPAYVRRNMDLFGNTLASVENYYSKYTVEQDENNQAQISTINTFLDGKKPD